MAQHVCPVCGEKWVERSLGRFGCKAYCDLPEKMRDMFRVSHAKFIDHQAQALSPEHDARMNARYDLNEVGWPVFFTTTSYIVLTEYMILQERIPEDETPEERHVRERAIFALWDEIETRGLFADPVPTVRRSYTWEGVTPYPGVNASEQELWDWRIENGGTIGTTYDNLQPPGGRAGKVGFNNTPDEENMGLYRREIKE